MDKVGKAEPKFSVVLFSFTILISLAGFLLALFLIAPAVWKVQINAGFGSLVIVFLVTHLVNAFMEYVFHRYVLHAPLVPFLSYFWKQHTIHHGLTRVIRKKDIAGNSFVENKYPIVDVSQYRASFFPWYSFLVFGLIFTPFLALIQWQMPDSPIFLGGFLALAWSISLYEIIHALEHFPLNSWNPLLNHRRFGGFWRLVYAFHLRHHADIQCNEAISGFFGLPIADWFFGTWVNHSLLYPDGGVVSVLEFQSPKPRFIGWLDRLSVRIIEKRRG